MMELEETENEKRAFIIIFANKTMIDGLYNIIKESKTS